MKSNKWMTMAAVLTLSTSLAIAAPHGDKAGKFGGKHGRGGEQRFAAKLNLTDAQKAQMKAIRQSSREANKAFYEGARTTFQEYRAAKKANDTATVARLEPIVEQQRVQLRQLRDAERQQFLAILTAEQRAQLETMKAERQSRKGNKRNAQ